VSDPGSQVPSGEAPREFVQRKPRPGDEERLVIEGFDEAGRGVARHKQCAWSVLRARPGAVVRAKALRRRRDQVEAVALSTLERDARAVAPECRHFGPCGGCALQDLAYTEQLVGKRALIEQSFARHGGLPEGVVVEPVLGAERTGRYRNKMEFTFGNRRWIAPEEPQGAADGFALGLHAAGLWQKVIDIEGCAIQSEVGDAILRAARELALALGLEPWDVRTHEGLLRHLVVRVSGTTGEVLANLVTSREEPERLAPFIRGLLERVPAISSFVQTINSRAAAVASGEREIVHHGPGWIREMLLGVEFRVSAQSFFQTNSAQAARLFELVLAEATPRGDELCWDLYCGTGTIALLLARRARAVVGFELAASAVADARENAARNGIANARFVPGDVLATTRLELERPDVVVVDPPRAGLHKDLLAPLSACGARRIVYVACKHGSVARDAALLAPLGWRVARVQPVDLFPHTPHVECVATFERAGGSG
jgi:23S rRNA (uracil1939-C5)-methyltransferase